MISCLLLWHLWVMNMFDPSYIIHLSGSHLATKADDHELHMTKEVTPQQGKFHVTLTYLYEWEWAHIIVQLVSFCNVYTYMCVCVYVCVCPFMRVYIYVCTYISTFLYSVSLQLFSFFFLCALCIWLFILSMSIINYQISFLSVMFIVQLSGFIPTRSQC